MKKIKDLLPDFISQVSQSLHSLNYADLAEQLAELELDRWTHDSEADAVYIHLSGQRLLNPVEQNVLGVRHGNSIELQDLDGMIVVDTDNFNRLKGIEILWRKDIVKRLDRICAPNNAFEATS